MSDHTTALVPARTWAFASPALIQRGRWIDAGLLGEALIYYDRVLLVMDKQHVLAGLLEWVNRKNEFGLLRSLLFDGVLEFYEYSFGSVPIRHPDGTYRFINLQDEAMVKPESFGERYLRHDVVMQASKSAIQMGELAGALANRVQEVKAEEFGLEIENAAHDVRSPLSATLLLQRLVDDLSRAGLIPTAGSMAVTVKPKGTDGTVTVDWGIDFDTHFSRVPDLGVGVHTVLGAASARNRFLWSASQLNCDLMCPPPMASLIGDKLLESSEAPPTPSQNLFNLKDFALFPDVRDLVNDGYLSLSDIVRIRGKAKRFRRWLQAPGQRDLDAFVAYHSEVARDRAIVRAARKGVHMFGLAAGFSVGQAVDPLFGPVGAAAAGEAAEYLTGLAAQMGAGWRPVVFGQWLEEELSRFRPS